MPEGFRYVGTVEINGRSHDIWEKIMSKTKQPPAFEHAYRLSGLFDLRRLLIEHLPPKELVASCITCQHFNEEKETCALATPEPMRPPARVIAYGCIAYVDNDDIPF